MTPNPTTALMNHHDEITRRQFLQRTSATGTAVAAGLGALMLERAAHAAGTDQFRIALIGCGGRGTGAAADCLRVAKHIKLVAVADAFSDRIRLSLGLLQKYFPDQVDVPPDRQFTGLDAYQRAVASDVHHVLLAAPPGFRPLHYRTAVEAGRHVFMEKPLCVDAAGFRSVMETNKLAERKGIKVGTGLFRRHHPEYLKIMGEIHGGAIGDINFMRCYCNMTAWGGGRPRQAGMSELEHQLRNWRCFSWLSGGRLVEAHCHELDIMDWAMQGHPVEANGIGGRHFNRGLASRTGFFGDDYDHHFNEYTYANGVKMYSQCRQIDRCWEPMTEHVHGQKGARTLFGKIRISQAADQGVDRTNPYWNEHADLIDAIWNRKPYHEGWFGATSSFNSILGREATYSGQVIKWDELAEKGGGKMPAQLTWETKPPVMPDEHGSYEHALPMPGVYKPF